MASKIERSIKLQGLKKDGTSARIGSEVRQFRNDKGSIVVKKLPNGNISVTTHKGRYELVEHELLNAYHGECAGVKVRFTAKKLVAQLTYWAA